MKYTEPTPDEYLNIAEKVRSGEYFREAKGMVDVFVNDTMAERYFYLFVTAVALLTFVTSLFAMQSLYPLTRRVPFVYTINDVLEDLPSIAPLRSSPHQSVNDAVLFFRAKNFVNLYESYNIALLERNYSGVEHDSSPEVFAQYQRLLSRENPESPVIKYQRHSARSIEIASVRKLDSPADTLEIVFTATVDTAESTSTKTRYRALLGYQYSGVVFDSKTATVAPVTFTVTRYSTTIQDRT